MHTDLPPEKLQPQIKYDSSEVSWKNKNLDSMNLLHLKLDHCSFITIVYMDFCVACLRLVTSVKCSNEKHIFKINVLLDGPSDWCSLVVINTNFTIEKSLHLDTFRVIFRLKANKKLSLCPSLFNIGADQDLIFFHKNLLYWQKLQDFERHFSSYSRFQ